MITAFVALAGLGLLGLALAFRAGVARAEQSRFVHDPGNGWRDGAVVARAVDGWFRAGRITESERDRLLALVKEENPVALDI